MNQIADYPNSYVSANITARYNQLISKSEQSPYQIGFQFL